MYHEAGHAIASLALWDEAAEITARNCFKDNEDEMPDSGAKFKIKIPFFGSDHKPLLDCIIACAAGAKAEVHKFGYESGGFVGDESKIKHYLSLARSPGEAILRADVASDYQKTGALLAQHAEALEAIGKRALATFCKRIGLRSYAAEQVILSAAELCEIFEAHKPS